MTASRSLITGRSPAFWRSPSDQPRWARPILLALTGLAGLAYAWNATGNLEVYYAAAVRSMAHSWHDFLFAAFDPAGTITLDKLPGAFWVQALSVRAFGVHGWALVAPQIVAGMVCVPVLYRIVRRVSGPPAAILAAGALVLMPATVALNRGNVPDTLMIMLLLLAADRVVSAVLTGRTSSVLWAGVLVGLAFECKMIEAWLMLPALGGAYLVGVTSGRGRRCVTLAAAGALAAVVSLLWMGVVSIVPASSRPYVDGSHSNSIFSQVFVYNGFGRVDQASPNQILSRAIGLSYASPPPGAHRLLTGAIGRDIGWLIPAALVALIASAVLARRGGRMSRVAVALWGLWLIALLVVFSVSSTVNSYYMGALSPPVAALLGGGVALAHERRGDRRTWLVVGATTALTCAYEVWLLPGHGAGVIAGLPWIEIALGLAAVLAIAGVAATATGEPRDGRDRRSVRGLGLAAIAVCAAPALASISIVANAFGPFDTPFETATAAARARGLGAVAADAAPLIGGLERASGSTALMATQSAAVASPFIYDSGREVLPIGGFTGTIPEPSLARLRSMIAAGDVHLVIQSPTATDPRLRWVAAHCLHLRPRARSSSLRLTSYYCGTLPLL